MTFFKPPSPLSRAKLLRRANELLPKVKCGPWVYGNERQGYEARIKIFRRDAIYQNLWPDTCATISFSVKNNEIEMDHLIFYLDSEGGWSDRPLWSGGLQKVPYMVKKDMDLDEAMDYLLTKHFRDQQGKDNHICCCIEAGLLDAKYWNLVSPNYVPEFNDIFDVSFSSEYARLRYHEARAKRMRERQKIGREYYDD